MSHNFSLFRLQLQLRDALVSSCLFTSVAVSLLVLLLIAESLFLIVAGQLFGVV